MIICIQNLVNYCQSILKLISKKQFLTSIKGRNSASLGPIWPKFEWELSVAMETRVPIRSNPKTNAAFPPSQWCLELLKFDCDWNTGCRDIHVWKCEQTDGRTPARVPSYKLTLWAFGSGELKTIEMYTALSKVSHMHAHKHACMNMCTQTNTHTHQQIFYSPIILS